MGKLSIDAFTVEDLSDGAAKLGRYKDSLGYLKSCTPAWSEVIANNPAAKGSDLALIVASDDGAAIGKLGMYPGQVCIGDARYRTFWLNGFFLEQDYKQSGLGGLMLLRAISHSKCLVAAGAPRDDARVLYLRAGFRELGPLRRLVYFFRAGVILKKYLRVGPLASVLSVPTAPLLRSYYFLKSRLNTRPVARMSHYRFNLVDKFSEHLNDLIREKRGNYFHRDAGTLNWALSSQENVVPFEVVREGRCVGYGLLQTRNQPESGPPYWLPAMRISRLLDYYLEGGTVEEYRALIDFCISLSRKTRADVFECQCHEDRLAEASTQVGMVHLGGNQVFFRPPSDASLDLGDSWFLTHGEGDVILGENY